MVDLVWIEKDGRKQCMFCKGCIAICPTEALKFVDTKIQMDIPDESGRPRLDEKPKLVWDKNKCTKCGQCIITCPEKVIRFKGK